MWGGPLGAALWMVCVGAATIAEDEATVFMAGTLFLA